MIKRVDLHAHTTASDGSVTPAELVELAIKNGLTAVAVTDHDTLEGLDQALTKGEELGFEVVPGVEISAEFKPGTMHLLGYCFDPAHPALGPKLAVLQRARKERNPRIIEKLNQLGLDITLREVRAGAGGGQVGRPHFAKVLVGKGYARDTQDAFDRFLTKGGPGYVEKFRFSPREALRMILEAGGVPVLAHPFTLKLDPDVLDALIGQLKADGLQGLEVLYSEHTPEMTRAYRDLAGKYGLISTGGSDYHGQNKPQIHLGSGFGDLSVPYEMLQALKDRRKLLHD